MIDRYHFNSETYQNIEKEIYCARARAQILIEEEPMCIAQQFLSHFITYSFPNRPTKKKESFVPNKKDYHHAFNKIQPHLKHS